MEIIDWAEKNHITLIKELNFHFSEKDYRDGIHINAAGQRKLAEIMKTVLVKE